MAIGYTPLDVVELHGRHTEFEELSVDRAGGRTTIGALAIRALARALAWLALLGRAGRSAGRDIGVVCGPDRVARGSRVGAEAFPPRGRVRREAVSSADVLREALSRPRRRSLLRRAPVLGLAFTNRPS